jgi:hypothetical protein
MDFTIERQLTQFEDSELSLLQPFKFVSKEKYSLQRTIFDFWYTFRVSNERMKEMYTNNIEVVKKYIVDNEINCDYLVQMSVYKSFEEICMKYITDIPKKYVVIRFTDDNECVCLVKRDDEFKLFAAKFKENSHTSKIYKEKLKDVEGIDDYIFVLSCTKWYDEITDIELVDMFRDD